MFLSSLFRPSTHARRRAAKVHRHGLEALESRITPTAGFADLTFGTTAVFTQDFATGGTDNDGAEAVVVQPDGKTIVAGFAQRGTTDFDFLVARLNRDGSLDTTFASPNGFTFVSFNLGSSNDDRARAVALDADGKIVVAGFATRTAGTDFAIARLNADGTLDNNFDTDGKQTVAFDLGSGNLDVANDLAIQADGKIVLGGSATAATAAKGTNFAAARLNADGSLDANFDTDGKVTVAVNVGGTNNDVAEGVALSGEKIILAGTAEFSAPLSEAAVVQLSANGALDTTFATGGIAVLRYDNHLGLYTGRDVAVQADGKIVVIGKADNASGTDSNFGIARLTPSGFFDPTFSDDGRRNSSLSPQGTREDSPEAILVQPDGKLVIAGTSNFGSTPSDEFFVIRLLPSGTNDTTYNSSGLRFYDLGPSGVTEDQARAVGLSADGIVVAGNTLGTNGTDVGVFRVVRDDWVIVAPTAKSTTVHIFTPTGTPLFHFDAFDPAFKGGVRIAAADINGDGAPEIFAAPGKGMAPVVRVFDGFTFELLREIPVLTPTFKGGVNIAVGDVLDPSTAPELIVAPGAGLAPTVEIYDPTTVGAPLKSFLAFAAKFKGGVRLAAIDSDLTGKREIAVGPQSGGGAVVKTFDANVATPEVRDTIQAFPKSFRGGVFLSASNVNTDGREDLVVGAGAGAPKVRIFDLVADTQLGELNVYGKGFTGGAQVSAGTIAGLGPVAVTVALKSGRPLLKVFEADTGTILSEFMPLGPTTKLSLTPLLARR